jgi:hypothetical protein
MNNNTQAAKNIINSIEASLQAVSYSSIMMENILDRAQELVNEDGYVWDVALAMACKMYPRTQYCGLAAYAK